MSEQEIEQLGAWDKRMPDRKESVCFERTSLPLDKQLSYFPEEDEQDVKYFKGIFSPHQVGAFLWWVLQPAMQ